MSTHPIRGNRGSRGKAAPSSRFAGKRRNAGLITGILMMIILLCVPVFAAQDTSYYDVDTTVSAQAREKYTRRVGGGRDKVTVMVYMIGSDLESENGMATADLNEMLYAQPDNRNINMFIQTGGCKRWRNSTMTAGKIERWKLDSGLTLLDRISGKSMTDPDTLASFIQFCAEEAPADRYMLIFWDHGGGSVTGYGYDEKYPNDTMNIEEIGRALQYGGVKFDLVGFDACLMATLETAMAIEPYADYMLASEESEPGTGWYYTRWLQMLDDNTSTNTLSLGRQIVDDFTSASSSMDYRVSTTLSLTDLSELEGVLQYLGSFGQELTQQLQSQDYQTVATARNGTREFAQSRRIDQVDLVDFCVRLGTDKAMMLAESIRNAVKYNKVNNASNAYGLSIYFPNSSLKSINSMLRLYDSIGMDPNWSEGVRTYATLESSGQIVANAGSSYGSSSGSLIDILLGSIGGSDSSGDSYGGADTGGYQVYDSYDSMGSEGIYDLLSGSSSAYSSGYDSGYDSSGDSSSSGYGYDSGYGDSSGGVGDMLSQLFGGYTTTSGEQYGGLDYSSMLGGYGGGYGTSYDSSSGGLLDLASQMLFGRAPVGSETLRLTEKDGQDVMVLSEDKWEQVTDVELNVFVDDGSGFLDLGLDNVAEYNEEGDLIDDWDGTWLTLQGQPCAVYPVDDEDADGNGLYITRKFIPALLNGERVNLLIEFNEETGEDRVLGAESVLESGVIGRGYKEMNGGDVLTLVCDYYDYSGRFQAQYALGTPIIVPEDGVLSIANMVLTVPEDGRMLYTYRLTDLYQAHYWLPIKDSNTEG